MTSVLRRHRGEGHVPREAETGVLQPQAGSQHKLKEARRILPYLLEGAQPWQHRDFELQASRIVRE